MSDDQTRHATDRDGLDVLAPERAWPPSVPTAVGDADLVVVRATGEDRLTYLDAVLSQQLADAPAGIATSALELGPKGEPTGVLDLAVLDDEVVVLVPSVMADDVVGRLAGRTFMSDVTFLTDEDAIVQRVRGPRAHAIAETADLAVEPGEARMADGVLLVGDRHGLAVVGPRDATTAAVAALEEAGAERADASVLDDIEIVEGRPRAPEEIARGRLPEELGLLPTHVHLDKGCYPGQEAVARMWQLGRPRRRLAVLQLDEPLDPGMVGEGSGRVELTRVATLGTTHVALGFVGRDVTTGDRPVDGLVVRSLVGDDLPVPGWDPTVTRRRDR